MKPAPFTVALAAAVISTAIVRGQNPCFDAVRGCIWCDQSSGKLFTNKAGVDALNAILIAEGVVDQEMLYVTKEGDPLLANGLADCFTTITHNVHNI